MAILWNYDRRFAAHRRKWCHSRICSNNSHFQGALWINCDCPGMQSDMGGSRRRLTAQAVSVSPEASGLFREILVLLSANFASATNWFCALS